MYQSHDDIFIQPKGKSHDQIFWPRKTKQKCAITVTGMSDSVRFLDSQSCQSSFFS